MKPRLLNLIVLVTGTTLCAAASLPSLAKTWPPAPLGTYQKPGTRKIDPATLYGKVVFGYPDCHYFWLDTPVTATRAQQAAFYDLLRRRHCLGQSPGTCAT